MKYLEDTLAEQCLSKTLYPNTKIYVNRKKVPGTLMTYTNELEVQVDFSEIDPSLLEENQTNEEISEKSEDSRSPTSNQDNISSNMQQNILGHDSYQKATISGQTTRFFRKKD